MAVHHTDQILELAVVVALPFMPMRWVLYAHCAGPSGIFIAIAGTIYAVCMFVDQKYVF